MLLGSQCAQLRPAAVLQRRVAASVPLGRPSAKTTGTPRHWCAAAKQPSAPQSLVSEAELVNEVSRWRESPTSMVAAAIMHAVRCSGTPPPSPGAPSRPALRPLHTTPERDVWDRVHMQAASEAVRVMIARDEERAWELGLELDDARISLQEEGAAEAAGFMRVLQASLGGMLVEAQGGGGGLQCCAMPLHVGLERTSRGRRAGAAMLFGCALERRAQPLQDP